MSTVLWCIGGAVVGCVIYNIVKASRRTESDTDRAERYSRSRKD